MGSLSIWHFLIVLAVVLLIWGPGRISPLMGELAKGVKSFKKGLSDDPNAASHNQHSSGNPANASPMSGQAPGVTAQNHGDGRNFTAHSSSESTHKG